MVPWSSLHVSNFVLQLREFDSVEITRNFHLKIIQGMGCKACSTESGLTLAKPAAAFAKVRANDPRLVSYKFETLLTWYGPIPPCALDLA